MHVVALAGLADLERPRDRALEPEQLVDGLGREGQERREDRLQVVDGLQRDVEHGAGALAIRLDSAQGSCSFVTG